jgi:hypothetical protein
MSEATMAMRSWVNIVVSGCGLACTVPAVALPFCCPSTGWQLSAARETVHGQAHADDAAEFFDRVVDRYRQLHLYQDTARVVQITQRNGRETSRVESQLRCEVADGKLNVVTPANQLLGSLGVALPFKSNQGAKEAKAAYDLWLAPHMAMKFAEQPLRQLRAGVDEGFTATNVEKTTIDNKPMVHVELRSGDGLSEDCTAKFDLYVNSDSMLIERIEGQQKLPDGAEYTTTVHITPTQHEPATYVPSPAAAPMEPLEDELPLDPVMPIRPPAHAPRT